MDVKEIEKKIEELGKEVKKKIEELGEEVERLREEKEDVQFQNDPIFLLSIEEYKKYKDKIPHTNCWWWLRSPGGFSRLAAIISGDGSVDDYGDFVDIGNCGVRPALKISNLKPSKTIKVDESRIICCGVTWIKVDNGLYIAEVPITFNRFDEESNNYATSEIRQILLDWYEERKEW